jgi:hypothetical protein
MSGMEAKKCEHCKVGETLNRKFKWCSPCQEELVQPCRKEGCENKRSLENAYCRLHKIHIFLDTIAEKGKKACSGYLRGCRTELDTDYPKKKCEECLTKDREKEKQLAEKKKESLPAIDQATGNKLCSNCFHYSLPDNFVGEKGEPVVRCLACREAGKKADANRNKDHRNALERVAAQRPNRKATKQEWAKYNQDKVLLKDRKYKAKMFLENPEAVLEKGREQAAVFREKNPEKMATANITKRMSKDSAYTVCKHTAASKKLTFEYTKDVFIEIVEKPCHFCGGIDDRGFNGIDRLDCHEGYTLTNGVPCCAMCNQLKASLSENVFLKRVEHLAVHGGRVEGGRRWPDAFPHSMGALLTGVERRANQLKVPFDLTLNFFAELHHSGCYLCGKENGNGHRNGTDRLDNTGGYMMTNVRACCGQCNYMKKDYGLQEFLNKLVAIYRYRDIGNMEFHLENEGCKSIEKHLDKMTKKEKTKKREEKKKAKLEKLAEDWPELVSK